ncbi:hypothetical protein DW080_03045 [Bacteroides caccae]|jgi:hypothetical protein|nr:hypothetical protein DW080_03045 [Bacteroides caccae]
MFFISKRTKAQFYNEDQMSFLVQKDYVDIIFKIQRGIYLTVSVSALSDDRLLLSCAWDSFWNRMRNMKNAADVLAKLKTTCPHAAQFFCETVGPHFAFLDKEKKEGAVVIEMKVDGKLNSFIDFLNEKVVDKASELIKYNLNLPVELEENCPYPQWKKDMN